MCFNIIQKMLKPHAANPSLIQEHLLQPVFVHSMLVFAQELTNFDKPTQARQCISELLSTLNLEAF